MQFYQVIHVKLFQIFMTLFFLPEYICVMNFLLFLYVVDWNKTEKGNKYFFPFVFCYCYPLLAIKESFLLFFFSLWLEVFKYITFLHLFSVKKKAERKPFFSRCFLDNLGITEEEYFSKKANKKKQKVAINMIHVFVMSHNVWFLCLF